MRIPADVDRPDTVLGDLTARQATVLTAGLAAMWVVAVLLHPRLPLLAALTVSSPLGLAAFAVVVARYHGLAGEQLVLAATRHVLAAKRLVPAPDGLPRPPAVAARATGGAPPPVAALQLPPVDISAQGIVDLAGDGAALLCAVTPVNFSLRTPAEQEGLVAVFARLLHADLGDWQLVVATRPADAAPLARKVIDAAGGLPHPALEHAARDHAAHLHSLAATHGLLTRDVLLVLHDPGRPEACAAGLARRAEHAAGLLAAAGVTVRPLQRDAVTATLVAALQPDPPATGVPAVLTDEILTRTGSAR